MSQSATEQEAPSGIVAAVRRFGDILAFVLLGYVAVELLVALGRLLMPRKATFSGSPTSSFAMRAFELDSSFLSLTLLGAVVLAVALVTVAGARSKLARPVVITALAVLGLGALLGLITTLASLFAHDSYGIFSGRAKAESFLGLILILAAYVLVGLILFRMLNAPELRPAPKPQPAYGQQYPGAVPQGYGGYQQPQGQPPVYGYQQPQGQYDAQPTYPAPAYDPAPQHSAPVYDQPPAHPQQPPQQQQQHGQPYDPSSPPIWEQPPPPPPPPGQPGGWPAPPQQPEHQQRWPDNQ